MDITHVKSLILVTLILVPGYLYSQAKARFVIVETPSSWQEKTLYFIVHSLILVGISFAMFILGGNDVVGLLTKKDTAQIATELLRWQWVTTVFILPLVFGFLTAMAIRCDLVSRLFGLFGRVHGINKLVPLPHLSAWDSAFLALNNGTTKILAVQLKSGAVIYGEFDAESCANRKGAYTDLFCTRALTVDESGTLIEVPNTKGLFVRGSEISLIHLFEADSAGKFHALPAAQKEDSAHDQGTPRSTV